MVKNLLQTGTVFNYQIDDTNYSDDLLNLDISFKNDDLNLDLNKTFEEE